MNNYIVDEEFNNCRIDQFLAQKSNYSRSKIVKLIKNELVVVDDEIVKPSYNVKTGESIKIIGELIENTDITPENIPLDIYYEDDDVIIVNKPSGMVVHPGNGNYSGTLVNALIYHTNSLSSDDKRPGIVHRIDKDTSGLLMVAKNDVAHANLASQLSKHDINRKYIALVWGVIKEDTATIDAPIGRDTNDRKKMAVTSINSKDAITHLRVIKRYKEVTLVELQLETGRTHQIRVHMNYIDHPVVNDPVYGRRKLIDETGQCLHAKTIGFIHPTTKKYMEFTSELPKCFTDILNKFEEEI